jgi:hypothetical protein
MSIRVIAYRDGDSWVAQCLEYDISAQGSDFDTAMQRLEIVVNAQCEYSQREFGQAFARIDPAPQAFMARWDQLTAVNAPPR